MKILLFVLIILALIIRYAVFGAVWLVRKILHKPAKKRSPVSIVLRHIVFPAVVIFAAFALLFPSNLPHLPSLPQFGEGSESVANRVFSHSLLDKRYFSADGFVYEAFGGGSQYYFRDVLYHYEEDGDTVICTDACGKEKHFQRSGNTLIETDGDKNLGTYRGVFTAKPNALSGRAFRGETDAHLGVESQFTAIFYDNGEYAFGWRHIGSGNLKGGDEEDYFGIYEYNALTKKVVLPEAGHWCKRDFVYNAEDNTLTGRTRDGDPFVMTEISFGELGLRKNEITVSYGGEDARELGSTVFHYSPLGSLVIHAPYRGSWQSYTKKFSRLNEYTYYRLYMRSDIEKYTVRRNETPFVPSDEFPDSFAAVTKRNAAVLKKTRREYVGLFGHTNYRDIPLPVFDIPQDNVISKLEDAPLYIESKIMGGDFATGWEEVYSVRFDKTGYPHKGEKLGWMVHYDVRLYGDIAKNFADSAEELQKRHNAELGSDSETTDDEPQEKSGWWE